ncbi:MAG: hypothetical protein FJX59_07595 [Alphaproteobacteria bacterium]|nr:hypothetical protein [Alphaproteobacteria bacterium]
MVPGQSHGYIVRRVNGIAWNPTDGKLYATSTTSEEIYRIDTKTGDVDLAVGAPWGEGDDIAFGPNGEMAWTAIATGGLRFMKPGGPVVVLDNDLPAANPVAFSRDGRLVAAQSNLADAIYEYDPTGKTPRRLIMKDMPDVNSFAFGPDGILYAPQRGGRTVAIDIDRKELRVVANDNGGAVKVAPDGMLITISKDHKLVRTDPKTGVSTPITDISGGADGLAVGPDGTIYASSPSESSIFAFDPTSGARRDVVRGQFSSLAGLSMAVRDGKEVLHAGDAWGFRDVDPVTGEVKKNPTRGLRAGGSSDLAINDSAIALSNARLGVVQKLDRASEKVLFESKEIKLPYGVALLDDGAIAVADIVGKRIARVDAAGTTTLAGGLNGPVGLARASDGALLVTDAYAGHLLRIDPVTGAKTELARGLRQPEGLALMADGRIAVAETGAGRLIAIDPKSNNRQTLADRLPFEAHVTATADKIGLPAGVAVGRDGTVYVSCAGDFSIRKVSVASRR